MSGFTIDELVIPETLDGPDGAAFTEMTAVRNAIETDTFGSSELEYTAEELLPGWLDREYEPKRLFVARVDGRMVSRAIFETRTEGSPEFAWLSVEVLPEFRGRGIGSAHLEQLAAIARESGCTTLHAYSIAKELPGERHPAPTGFGSVPLADDGVRFLLARGWTLEQVERSSRLALPVEPALLAQHLAEAQAASGADYRVHTWIDRTPAEWLGGIAMLSTRMSTDAPSAGMDAGEEIWTVERVLESEEKQAASPRHQLVAAVEHVPSGTLAGYTELSVPPELDRPVSQEDTIVIREHRGHRLGMLLKIANIEHLARTHPGHPSITTFNAEENRHMLSVNEAVCFVPVAYEGAWKRML
jgi:GNAT superfamily N-acetyltransferase